MRMWPTAYDPSSPITSYERREIVRAGFAELQPSYKNSLESVRRGKKNTNEVDQLTQLNSCERDLIETYRVICKRAKQEYFGDILSLDKKVDEILSEREMKVLNLARYRTFREIAEEAGISQGTVFNTIKTATEKVSKARSRQKNKLLWLLTNRQTAVWELLQTGVSIEVIAGILEFKYKDVLSCSERITIAQKALAMVEDLDAEIMSALSVDQRIIYILTENGMKACEIAQFTEKSKQTVYDQQARIRGKLKNYTKP